jgi:hypothetical protein
MRNGQDTAIEALMEQLIANGAEDMGVVFAGLFDLAMRIERERFLGAEHYQRTAGRRGYRLSASSNASTQNSVSMVFDNRQASTWRVAQSKIATR